MRPLRGDGGGDAVLRPAEGNEEAFALGVHLVAAVIGDRRTDELGVTGQDVAVVPAEGTNEARRSFDVREEEGHGPPGSVAHLTAGHRCTAT